MIFGRPVTAILVTLGQILLLTDVLQCAQGLLIVPDRIFENNRSSVAEKRDGSDAGDSDWVEVPGWPSFLLQKATCASSVTDTNMAAFTDILDDILEINRGALDTISTLESAWDKMSNGEDLSAEENTQINFYMAMYGTFKQSDSTGMERAKDRIAQLKVFANEFVEGLDKDAFNIRIICHEDAWELSDYDDDSEGWLLEDGPLSYVVKRDSTSQNSVCQDANGETTVLAFMIPGRDGHDYMTLCPFGWDRFTEATPIPVQKAKSLAELEYKDLDDIAKKPADGVFVHELTHSDYFWGELATNDVALDDGTTAYGFEKIVDLAKQGNDEDDVSKLRALKNADTYKYWAVGAYLNQCDWSTGTCINPEDLIY